MTEFLKLLHKTKLNYSKTYTPETIITIEENI